MKAVITNGIYRNNEISGEFEVLKTFWKDSFHGIKKGKIKIVDPTSGKPRQIWVNPEDVKMDFSESSMDSEAPFDKETAAESIRERFDVLSTLSDGIIGGHINSLIVSGAPGVGKTYSLETKLKDAFMNSRIRKFSPMKGAISAIGLYTTLYENSEPGNVVMLDDMDSIFNDEECMNLLKGALDTSEVRTISWMKDSNYLEKNDIPKSFDFKGQVVFLTNIDIEAGVRKGGKMAPHLNALMSRSLFLDMEIHTNEQIMVRVEQVLKETDMSIKLKLNESQVDEIVNWMNVNIQKLRSVSLRTVIQLASFVKTSDNWESLAKVTLLKKM